MAHQIVWTKRIYEAFVEEGFLNEFELKVLKTRVVDGMTITQQMAYLNCSKSTVDRTIAKLKNRYDEVQKHRPDLPVRTSSKTEDYLDTH